MTSTTIDLGVERVVRMIRIASRDGSVELSVSNATAKLDPLTARVVAHALLSAAREAT